MLVSEDYKVRYQRLDGMTEVSDWYDERGARRFFDRLKNEKVRVTRWAELVYSPIDDEVELDEIIVDDFERKVVEVMGHKLLV